MPHFHLDISIGPVGDFIAGGRRSRDLWWGSTWLSECTLAVARRLREDPRAKLQVPSEQRLLALSSARDTYGARVANHIRATVDADTAADLLELARGLRRHAHATLAEILEARRGVAGVDFDALVDRSLWEQQVAAIRDGDFIEFSAAWSPSGSRRSGRLLAASKSCRPFDPAPGDTGRPKSHLDPGRDSVLGARAVQNARRERARARVGLGRDEQLDAVSLARRLAAFSDPTAPELPRLPFPPISRIALDPWLAAASRRCPEALGGLRDRLHRAARDDRYFALWCSAAVDPEQPRPAVDSPATFPFDASILLEDGPATLRALWARTLPTDEPPRHLDEVAPLVHRLHRDLGPPDAYYALLAADGDGVGQVLDDLRDDQVPELVAALDGFADAAADVVAAHHGRAFFAGGDDLLAYVPVDTLLWGIDGGVGLPERLAGLFDEHLHGVLSRLLGDPSRRTSLSFGVVIAHVKDDLRVVRGSAEKALKRAKGFRRRHDRKEAALCIRERVRSGAQRDCIGDLGRLTGDLQRWLDLCRTGALSQRTAHHLLSLHDLFAASAKSETFGLELARASEFLRHERRDADDLEPITAPLATRLADLDSWRAVRDLAHEFLLAERLLPARRLRVD